MKELQKYGFLRFVCVLVLLTWLCLDGFSQEVKWKQTDNVYIKTSTGIKVVVTDNVIPVIDSWGFRSTKQTITWTVPNLLY